MRGDAEKVLVRKTDLNKCRVLQITSGEAQRAETSALVLRCLFQEEHTLPAEPLCLWCEVKRFGFSRIPASLSQCLPVLRGHAHPLVLCPGEAGAQTHPSSQLSWKAGGVLSVEGHT